MSARRVSYPPIYRLLLSAREQPDLIAAREAANTYKRPALRAAFDAGWFAVKHRHRLGEGWTAPHFSSLARSAFRRGFTERMAIEDTQPTTED